MFRPFHILTMSLFLSSCQSYTAQTHRVRQDFIDRRYSDALRDLDDSEVSTSSSSKLVYLLERSSILDRMGDGPKARQTLFEADRLVDKLYRPSLVGEAASYIYNDSASDYTGEDYEKVAIHTLLALSFLGDGKLKKARVEARAINVRLNEINNFYKKNKNKYKEDAFARFLSAMIFESLGDYNNALVDYRAALRLYEGDYSRYFRTSTPVSLVRSMWWLARHRGKHALQKKLKRSYPEVVKKIAYNAQMAHIVLISEVGYIANKISKSFIFTWDQKPMRFSFPAIRLGSPGYWGKIGLYVDAEFYEGGRAQFLDNIARETLEDSRARYMIKMASRIVLKDQISQQAKKSFGVLGELAVSIFGAATEMADTRAWTLLPSQYYVTRVAVKPGTHKLRVSGGGISSAVKIITLKAGEFRFIRDKG